VSNNGNIMTYEDALAAGQVVETNRTNLVIELDVSNEDIEYVESLLHEMGADITERRPYRKTKPGRHPADDRRYRNTGRTSVRPSGDN
jgi:hypothetical protein